MIRLCAEAIAFAAERPCREVWVGNGTVLMRTAKSLIPSLADRQTARFMGTQLGAPMPARDCNVEHPAPGPTAIDGHFSERVRSARSQFYTSRQRDGVKLGGLAALAGAGLTGAWLCVRRR